MVALKSDFEALEMGALAWAFGQFAPWLRAGTLAVVLGGLSFAFAQAGGVRLPWPELRLSQLQKSVLGGLFAIYLATVAATLFISHRA
jgi:hypothetical protein